MMKSVESSQSYSQIQGKFLWTTMYIRLG